MFTKLPLSLIFSASLLFSTAHAIDSFDAHVAETKSPTDGKALYEKYCADCHHNDRIGIAGPPLLPEFLKKYKIKDLIPLIREGFPQTLMPKYDFLKVHELLAISDYIKSPIDKNFVWREKEIKASITPFDDKPKDIGIKDIEQVLPVVERDGGYVWIMEDEKILDKFPLANVHGGIKYTMDGKNIYVPTRDGWVERYSLEEGRRIAKVRPCINLRNVSVERNGKYAIATCLLPHQMVVLDTMTLEPTKVTPLEGKVSALYEFYSKDEAIFTYRDKPKIGIVDTKTFEITYTDIEEPIEDFFIDPFDKFIIATARRGKMLRVYDLATLKPVYEHAIEGMPHLFSATYWYEKGNFYFATPHLRKPYITVWKMYDWDYVKKIETGGDGFFVKTHPNTPYLWIDNGTDEMILVNKEDFSSKTLVPVKGKQYIHAEFTGDGEYAYLSIYEKDGSIEVWNTKTFEKLHSYPANIPVGKYNFINKNRDFYPRLFGLDMFNQQCAKAKEAKACMNTIEGLNSYEKISRDDFVKSMDKGE